MRVYSCEGRDTAGKMVGVIEAFPAAWSGKVLDVGCRSAELREALPSRGVDYVGLDRWAPADVVADLQGGLPWKDCFFDAVVALDVLEHVDDIHRAFAELCRVSRSRVVICLPNGYELRARLGFLLGRLPSGKYGLPVDPPTDRHRWLFSFEEGRRFASAAGQRQGFEMESEGCLVGPRRASGVAAALVRRLPNLLSTWYLVCLRRQGDCLHQEG